MYRCCCTHRTCSCWSSVLNTSEQLGNVTHLSITEVLENRRMCSWKRGERFDIYCSMSQDWPKYENDDDWCQWLHDDLMEETFVPFKTHFPASAQIPNEKRGWLMWHTDKTRWSCYDYCMLKTTPQLPLLCQLVALFSAIFSQLSHPATHSSPSGYPIQPFT